MIKVRSRLKKYIELSFNSFNEQDSGEAHDLHPDYKMANKADRDYQFNRYNDKNNNIMYTTRKGNIPYHFEFHCGQKEADNNMKKLGYNKSGYHFDHASTNNRVTMLHH